MSEELKTAIEAARAGAKSALKYFENLPPVIIKPDNTPVTKADKETEEIIRKTILQAFPNASFVGEELGGSFGKDDVWIIDPIDGTKNFIRAIPFWAILIALQRENEIIVGVSYMPSFDELLFAEKDAGAFLNGKKVTVSNVDQIKNATITYTGNPFSFNIPQNVEKLLNASAHTRGFGDALSYHLVASGRAEVNFEPEINIWDVAPLKVIIENAGGKITSLNGSPWSLEIKDFVATNGLVHDEVIRILNEKIS
ncbi:MAG: inositol monophosphatase [Candidatus Levybacteria bacterium]|nr:inositol monophosphatase [Candidatus Levybacteria bacterium]